jgi:hypothetical protein
MRMDYAFEPKVSGGHSSKLSAPHLFVHGLLILN